MPRGAKTDIAVTKMMHDNRIFADSRSFVSLDAHLFLYGQDKEYQRSRVFADSRGLCVACGREITWETFEWDHVQGGLVGRCDCLHNAAAKCRECHRNKHVQVQLGKGERQ